MNFLSNIPVEFYQMLFLGILSSPASVPIIKWLNIPSHRDGLRVLTVLIVSGLSTFVAYMNTSAPTFLAGTKYGAVVLLVLQALATGAVAIVTFHTATKPLRGKLEQAYTDAALINAAKATAKIPADGQIFSK